MLGWASCCSFSFEIQHENEAMSTVYKSFCMGVRNVMYSDVIFVRDQSIFMGIRDREICNGTNGYFEVWLYGATAYFSVRIQQGHRLFWSIPRRGQRYFFTKMTSLYITFLTSMQKLLYIVDMAWFSCWISKKEEEQEAQPNIYGNLYYIETFPVFLISKIRDKSHSILRH